MPRLTYRTADDDQGAREVEVSAGDSVMEGIRDSGYDGIFAVCGGCLNCATCHVHVDSAWSPLLSPPDEDEKALLEGSAHYGARSRLSCQISMSDRLDGIAVTIAPEE